MVVWTPDLPREPATSRELAEGEPPLDQPNRLREWSRPAERHAALHSLHSSRSKEQAREFEEVIKSEFAKSTRVAESCLRAWWRAPNRPNPWALALINKPTGRLIVTMTREGDARLDTR